MKITVASALFGCSWWRTIQPCQMLERLGLAEVKYFNHEMNQSELENFVNWGDVIVFQSSMGIPMVATMSRLKESGKTVVGDYDDLSFALSPFNPSYKTLGINEVKITHGNEEGYIWKDGVDGFSIKANYFRYKSLQDLLKIFHMVTTTTPFIKEKYSEFNKDILILPNSIDFKLFRPFPKKENKQIRIGWTASDSHYSEIWMVKRIMRKVLDKYKDSVRFVLFGNLVEISQAFEKDSYERHDFISLELYPMKQASLNLDIGICPLDAIDFNRAKSQLKWSEYASLRIPSVCSDIDAYSCVKDGVTGLKAKTEEEFFDKICALVDDAKLRKTIADNAFDDNYENYNLEKNAVLWAEAYEQAMEKKCESQLLGKEVSVKDTPKILQTSDIV
jgi:glycosyltransferase involved in cell wall biosynthesis